LPDGAGSGKDEGMASCAERAILIITGDVDGTSTTLARGRVELRCSLPHGHPGSHHDPENAPERWEASPGQLATLLRHEPEQ
jgi:hypothetical protein